MPQPIFSIFFGTAGIAYLPTLSPPLISSGSKQDLLGMRNIFPCTSLALRRRLFFFRLFSQRCFSPGMAASLFEDCGTVLFFFAALLSVREWLPLFFRECTVFFLWLFVKTNSFAPLYSSSVPGPIPPFYCEENFWCAACRRTN